GRAMRPSRPERSTARRFPLELRKGFLRDPERIDGRGNAGVDSDVQQHLADFLLRAAVADRALDVHLELVMTVQRAEQRDIQVAPRLLRQLLAAPDGAPAILGHEALQRHRKVVRAADRLLDVLRAEDRLSDREAALE